jgi:hypothetical protein
MKKKTLCALLLLVLMVLGACSGATHTCSISGLIAGHMYMYQYVNAEGVGVTEIERAPSDTIEVPNLPMSVECGSFHLIGEVELMVDPPVS